MREREFDQLLQTLPALTSEQLHALRRGLESQRAALFSPPADDEDLQRRLLSAGIVSEIKPPVQDSEAYRNCQAVPIQGEPLSATVIRERR